MNLQDRRFLIESKNAVEEFIKDTKSIDKFIEILSEARDKGRNVYVFGNGGSSATASHFVCDLLKTSIVDGKERFRAISLTDNVPVLSAWANDVSYQDVFAEQLKNFIKKDDVAVAISGSGNSPNVLKAVALAKEMGAITVGFTGSSGRLGEITDIPIRVPSGNILLIEGVHSVLLHYVAEVLRGW